MLREIHALISRNFLKKMAYKFTWFKKKLGIFMFARYMQLKEINKNTQMYLKWNFHDFRIIILQIFRRIQIFI